MKSIQNFEISLIHFNKTFVQFEIMGIKHGYLVYAKSIERICISNSRTSHFYYFFPLPATLGLLKSESLKIVTTLEKRPNEFILMSFENKLLVALETV